jgi:hypothetical protein
MKESMKARKERERQLQVLSLWLQRPPGKRTGNDLVMFYGELLTSRRELLMKGRGDP